MARIKDTMKVISDTRGKIDKNYDRLDISVSGLFIADFGTDFRKCHC